MGPDESKITTPYNENIYILGSKEYLFLEERTKWNFRTKWNLKT